MALILAALAVGAVVGYFVSGGASDKTPVANNIEIINNVTSKMTVTNDTTCSAEVRTFQNISVECSPVIDQDKYCKRANYTTDEGFNVCKALYAPYAATVFDFGVNLKNSDSCKAASSDCGCEGASDLTACMGSCSVLSRNACFGCVVLDLNQDNIATATVTTCEQMVITAAKMKASVDASSTQTNKIVADGLAAALGNKVQGNATLIESKVNTGFEFNNALTCTALITNNQNMVIRGGPSTFVSGMTQNNSVSTATKCLQQSNSYGESTTSIVARTSQALDQTYKSPFSFLTDVMGMVVIGIIVVVVIIVIIIGVILGGAVKSGRSLTAGLSNALDINQQRGLIATNSKKQRNLKICASIAGVIILAAIITVIVIAATAPATLIKNSEVLSTVQLPKERTILQTIHNSKPYMLYAAGPFLIGMQQEYVNILLGADKYSTNQLAGQAVGRFLLRINKVDKNLPIGATEPYTGRMFQTVEQRIGTASTYLRSYVGTRVTRTDISEVIKGQTGTATYVNLTSDEETIADLTFEPRGDAFPGAAYIYRMSTDSIPQKLYLTMTVVEVNENFSEEVQEILEEHRDSYAERPEIIFPTQEQVNIFSAKTNYVQYGFTDWISNPAEKTAWQASQTMFFEF